MAGAGSVKSSAGTYTVWFMDSASNTVSKSVVVTSTDSIPPTCTIEENDITYGSTGTIAVSCTDTGSGLYYQKLTTSNFTSSNTNVATITAVSDPIAITNGYKYNLTINPVSAGSYNLSIKAGAVRDDNGNTNTLTTKAETITYKTYTITLDGQSASTQNTSTLYGRYKTGLYLDNSYEKLMTTSTNNITIPVKVGYTFGGYYTSTGGSGTQMIDANGYLTSSFTTTTYNANTTWYAKWTANTVVVNINKDGAAYSNSSMTVTLYNGTTATSYTSSVTSGSAATLTAVPAGNYNVYIGKDSNHKTTMVDSGVDASVTTGTTAGGSTTVTVNYQTLTMKGTQVSNLTVNSSTITSGGTVVVAKSVAHAISGTVNPGFTFASWTVTTGATVASSTTLSTNATLTSAATITAVALDQTNPTSNINTTNTLNQTSQTVTLSCEDLGGVAGYYFGSSSPTASSSYTATSGTSATVSQTVTSAGTFYLGCKDAAGNISSSSVTIYSYVLKRMVLNVTGNSGTYTTANYTLGTNNATTSTYLVPSGTSITVAQLQTLAKSSKPTGTSDSTYKIVSKGVLVHG